MIKQQLMALRTFTIQTMHAQVLSIALCTLLALPLPASADNPLQTNPVLSLERAVAIALKHSPTLSQQVNAVKSAEINVSQQQADYYPEVTLKGSESEDLDMSVELSSSVNLFNGFADVAAKKNAELLLETELESLSQEEQTLMFETISNFIQVLTDQELIDVKETSLEENRKLLEKIETFYNAGKLPVSDLYQQQAETKQAEFDLLEAQHAFNKSKLLLMQSIGMTPTIHYQVTSPDFEKLSFTMAAEDSDGLTRRALLNRSDIKAQKRQIEAAEQQVRLNKGDGLPKIDLVADIDEDVNSTLALTLSIPLFDRFESRNNTAKARIEKHNEQLTLQEKKLQVGLEVTQAIQDLQKTQKQIEVVESKLTHARQALQAYEERYRVGASTLVELTQARTQYVTAAFDQVEAKYSLITQEISVAYYLGDLNRMFAALAVEKE
jgi:outer membrane protein